MTRKSEKNPIPLLFPLLLVSGAVTAIIFLVKKKEAAPVTLPKEMPLVQAPSPEKTPEEKLQEGVKKAEGVLKSATAIAGTVGAGAKLLGLTGSMVTGAIFNPVTLAVAVVVTQISYLYNKTNEYRHAIKKKKELTTQAEVAAKARVDSGRQLRELRIANAKLIRDIIVIKDQLGLDASPEYKLWNAYQGLIPIDYWNTMPSDVPRVEELYADAYEGLTPEEKQESLAEGQGALGQLQVIGPALTAACLDMTGKARRAEKRAKKVLLLLLSHIHYLNECQKDIERELAQSDALAEQIIELGVLVEQKGLEPMNYEDAKKAGIFSGGSLDIGVSGMLGAVAAGAVKPTGLKSVTHFAPTRAGQRNPEVITTLRSNLDKILKGLEARITANVNAARNSLYFGKYFFSEKKEKDPAYIAAVEKMFAERDAEIKRLWGLSQLLDVPDASKVRAILGDIPHAGARDWEREEIMRLMEVATELPTGEAVLKTAEEAEEARAAPSIVAPPVIIAPAIAPIVTPAMAPVAAPSIKAAKAIQGFFENVSRRTMY